MSPFENLVEGMSSLLRKMNTYTGLNLLQLTCEFQIKQSLKRRRTCSIEKNGETQKGCHCVLRHV